MEDRILDGGFDSSVKGCMDIDGIVDGVTDGDS